MSGDNIVLRILETRREIADLVNSVPTKKRCQYLRMDKLGPYCGKDFKGKITNERRMVCDGFSLQLYCLSEHGKCCFYTDRFSFYS